MKKKISNIWKRNQVMITALACMIAIAGYFNFTGKELKNDSLYTTSAQFEEVTTSKNETDEEIDLVDSNLVNDEGVVYDISEEDIGTTADIESLDEDFTTIENGSVADVSEISESETVMESGSENTQNEIEVSKGAEPDEVPGEAVFTSTTGISSLSQANMMREQIRAQNKASLLDIINNAELSDAVKVDAVNSMISLTETAQMECDAEILLEAKGFENAIVSISKDKVDVLVGASELSDAQRAQIEDIVKRKTDISAENIVISPISAK